MAGMLVIEIDMVKIPPHSPRRRDFNPVVSEMLQLFCFCAVVGIIIVELS